MVCLGTITGSGTLTTLGHVPVLTCRSRRNRGLVFTTRIFSRYGARKTFARPATTTDGAFTEKPKTDPPVDGIKRSRTRLHGVFASTMNEPVHGIGHSQRQSSAFALNSSARPKSGAEATRAVRNAERRSRNAEWGRRKLRGASGLRRVHRRFARTTSFTN
jgi:hypothetical protein